MQIDVDRLRTWPYNYTKIRVSPWSRLSLINSEFAEPKSKTRHELLKGLEKIYCAWRSELEKLGEPYYLKIWVFEPRFSESQVVCAIGDKINWYENLLWEIRSSSTIPNFDNKLISQFKWKEYNDFVPQYKEDGEDDSFVLRGRVWVGEV